MRTLFKMNFGLFSQNFRTFFAERQYKVLAIFPFLLIAESGYPAADIFTDALINQHSNLNVRKGDLAQDPDKVCADWVFDHLVGAYRKPATGYDDVDGYCRLWTSFRLHGALPYQTVISAFFNMLVIAGILLEALDRFIPKASKARTRDETAKEISHNFGLFFLVEGLMLELANVLGAFDYLMKPANIPAISKFLGHLTYEPMHYVIDFAIAILLVSHVILPLLVILRSAQEKPEDAAIPSVSHQAPIAGPPAG